MPGTDWLTPDSVQIVAWATAAGAASMLLYRFASPQQRLKQLESEGAAARLALSEHEGELQEAWPLIRRSLAIALVRVRLAFVPSLLAGLPVLSAVYLMEDKLSAATMLPCGPAWVQSGWVAFFTVAGVAALFIKVALRIK